MLVFLFYYYLNLISPKQSKITPDKTGSKVAWIVSIYGSSSTNLFKGLMDVAFDKDNNIYIPDLVKDRIYIFDSVGRFIEELATPKSGNGVLETPAGIDVDKDNGEIYVADSDAHKIFVFNRQGKLLREWGVMYPHIPKVYGDKVYVSTYGPFYIFDKHGKQLAKWGKRGKKKSEFNRAYGVHVDKDENVFIADMMNARVVSRSGNGDFNWVSGQPKAHMNDWNTIYQTPTGITADENGILYVADGLGNDIKVLTQKGKLIETMGELGSSDGMFDQLSLIEYMGDRKFAVVDKGNVRVQVVQLPITEKISKAIEKETGNKVATTKSGSFFSNHFGSILRFLGLR